MIHKEKENTKEEENPSLSYNKGEETLILASSLIFLALICNI